ncbi:hypothetical protein FisN_20Lh184 [Fistulifera solaris]|uniref:SPX domain-containing protein n=1 Tax=Fistulifera solaris TaxID=1519565 RepID=A0A1Z5KRD7_FISSO|nr:hypothetical protein FisN_20Lh184 [Fistulifera solaris]|eukprot:GAX28880.1 hypothetical protein FisN_20Lh184 [Fistulifera solaris]
MVEFGLKLEDNKVEEWSEYYIQYERLKKILKKCKEARQKCADLEEKRPDEAATIRKAVESGLSTPHQSSVSLPQLSEPTSSSGNQLNKISEDSHHEPTSELSSLFHPLGTSPDESSGRYSSYGSESALTRAFSGVSDYFSRSFERQFRDAMKEALGTSNEFDEALDEEIKRVNDFYFSKMKELEQRLIFLKESVKMARGQNADSVSDSDETPLITQRKGESSILSLNAQTMEHLAAAVRRRLTGSRKSCDSNEDSTQRLLGDEDEDIIDRNANPEDARKMKEAQSIKRALIDEYRTAKLLHNFSIMNYTGFVKIVKKYDKTIKESQGKFKKIVTSDTICNGGKDVEGFANRLEFLFANWFCDRDINEARAQMLPKKGDGLQMDWSQLRLGYRMGMCSVLALWVCWDCIWGMLQNGSTTIGGRTAFPVFRGFFGLLLVQWFWGASVWVWTRYRVNYIYIMDLDPHLVRSPIAIFNDSVDDTLFYLITMLLYYKAGVHDIPGNFPAGIFPAIAVCYALYRLIFPLQLRIPMWTTIWEVITAPMTSPAFYHSYIGDIFTSMVKVFQDLAWTTGFMLSGDFLISEDSKRATSHTWSHASWYKQILIPLLTLAPLWFRFNQCLRRYMDTGNRFPHLANAFKYALTQTVTLFGAFHPLYMTNKHESALFQLFWTCAFVSSSLYSFFWDVYMDWGYVSLH